MILRPLCIIFVIIAVILTGKFLLVDDPFFNWGYFAIMIAAADQIRTKIIIGERYEQQISLSPIATIWAALYLDGPQAFYAAAVAYLFTAGILEWKAYSLKKRIVNTISMIMSSGCMIFVYNAFIDAWDAVWPSLAASVAAMIGMVLYDIVNVATLALPLHYAERLSWREIYNGWIDYIYYPVLTALAGIAMAAFVSAFNCGLPLLAVAIVMFLKPQYSLPPIGRAKT